MRQVLLTRPRADSERIAAQLVASGIDSLIWPQMQIVPLGQNEPIPADVDALVLTSAHAVRCLGDETVDRDIRTYCVGAATADAAHDAGFTDVVSADGTSIDLIPLVNRNQPEHVLYPRGREVARDLAGDLARAGVRVTEQIVYGADPGEPAPPEVAKAMHQGRIGAVTVWSARQGAILVQHLADHPDWPLDTVDLIAISDNGARALQKSGFRRILVASQPDAAAMVQAIIAAMRQKAG